MIVHWCAASSRSWAFLNGEKEYFFIKQKGMTDGLCHNSSWFAEGEARILRQGAVECSVGKRHLVSVHVCSARVLCAPDSHRAGSRLSIVSVRQSALKTE